MQLPFTPEEMLLRRKWRQGLGPARRHPLQRRLDGVQCRQDTAFEPAQGGEAIMHERPLQRTDVAMPERKIMGEIQSAGGKCWAMDLRPPVLEGAPPLGRHMVAQIPHFPAQFEQPAGVQAFVAFRRRNDRHLRRLAPNCDNRSGRAVGPGESGPAIGPPGWAIGPDPLDTLAAARPRAFAQPQTIGTMPPDIELDQAPRMT